MLSSEQFDQIVSTALQSGLDDWVDIGKIVEIASYYGAPDVRVTPKDTTVPDWAVEPVVRHLVGQKLMRIGDVYSRGYFVPFDGDDEAAIEWFMGVLRTLSPAWPFEAWLELTEAGTELARSLPPSRFLEVGWEGDDGMVAPDEPASDAEPAAMGVDEQEER